MTEAAREGIKYLAPLIWEGAKYILQNRAERKAREEAKALGMDPAQARVKDGAIAGEALSAAANLGSQAVKKSGISEWYNRFKKQKINQKFPKSKIEQFIDDYNTLKPTLAQGWDGLKEFGRVGFDAYKQYKTFNNDLRNPRYRNQINNAPNELDELPSPRPMKIVTNPNPHPPPASNEPFPKYDDTFRYNHRGYTYPPPEKDYFNLPPYLEPKVVPKIKLPSSWNQYRKSPLKQSKKKTHSKKKSHHRRY